MPHVQMIVGNGQTTEAVWVWDADKTLLTVIKNGEVIYEEVEDGTIPDDNRRADIDGDNN